MLGPNFKIGTLVPAICLVLLLANYHGCSAAKKKRPSESSNGPMYPVVWKDLDPKISLDSVPFSDEEGSSASRKVASSSRKKNPQAPYEIKSTRNAGKTSKANKKDAKAEEDLHGARLLRKHGDLLRVYAKKLQLDVERGLRRAGKEAASSKRSSHEQFNLNFLADLTRQAICVIESVIGFGFPFKMMPEWRQRCCFYPVLRIIAPITCSRYDPEDGGDSSESGRHRTKRPKRKKPKKTKRPTTSAPMETTTPEPEVEPDTTPQPSEAPDSEPDPEPTTTTTTTSTTTTTTTAAPDEEPSESEKSKGKNLDKKKGKEVKKAGNAKKVKESKKAGDAKKAAASSKAKKSSSGNKKDKKEGKKLDKSEY